MSSNQNEISRILNSVEELINDLEILQYIPTGDENSRGYLSETSISKLSEDARQSLQELLEAESELSRVQSMEDSPNAISGQYDLSSPNGGVSSPTGHVLAPNQLLNSTGKKDASALQEYTEKVRIKTKEVCIQFTKCEFTPSEEDEKSESLSRFLDVMKQYKNVLEDKLNTTVEEEESRREIRNATTTRENKATADVKALKRELDSEKAARSREMDQRKQDVRKLRNEIILLQENEEAERATTTERLASKEKQKEDEFIQMKEYLEKQISVISEALNKKKEENQQLEDKLRIMRKNSETKVGSVVQKYDQFMFETLEKLETLKKDFELDSQRYAFLEQELVKFRTEKVESKESDQRKKEVLRRNLVKAQAYVNAKVAITRVWQNYKAKNAPPKKKSKKPKA